MLPNDPATDDEVRHLAARVDARFQAVNARFATVDDRFTLLDDRLHQIERRLQALARSSEARCTAIDAHLDAARARTGQVRSQLLAQIDHARRDLGRVLLLGLVGTTLTTAALCVSTILVLLT